MKIILLAHAKKHTSCQKIVTDAFDLPHAHFMKDQWHLFDSMLPKRFKGVHFESINISLRRICDANSEAKHTLAFNDEMNTLK